MRRSELLYVGWLVLLAALGLTMIYAGLVSAGSRPECPPGVVCELPTLPLPTQTPPVEVTSEPYPPPENTPEPYPYPAGHARPAPGDRVYLPGQWGEGDQ